MVRLLRFGLGFLLALALVSNVFAAAGDGTTAATAIPLPASLSATTTLAGSTGGAFVYYTFTSSHAAAATLSVTVTPSTSGGVGVNLYQAGALIASTNGVSPSASDGAQSLSFGVAPGPVLVQVYNYAAGQSAAISFGITGIDAVVPASSSASASAGSGTSAPASLAPAQPAGFVAASSTTLITWGSITGSAGGAYRYYTFNIPANRATGAITLVVSSRDPDTNRAVGINLLQDDVTLASINTASAVPGVNSAGFPLTTAGQVRVQVYDYLPGKSVDYAIVVAGPGITP